MISERFDESMVLMADLLCWPLEKVTSLKVNARKPHLKVSLGFSTVLCGEAFFAGSSVFLNFNSFLDHRVKRRTHLMGEI